MAILIVTELLLPFPIADKAQHFTKDFRDDSSPSTHFIVLNKAVNIYKENFFLIINIIIQFFLIFFIF